MKRKRNDAEEEKVKKDKLQAKSKNSSENALQPKTKKNKKKHPKQKTEAVSKIVSEPVAIESSEEGNNLAEKKELQKISIVKKVVDSIFGKDETQLVIFIFNYLKYCGKKAEKNLISCEFKELSNCLKELLPRLQYLLNRKFVETHAKELNITEFKEETIIAKPIGMFFSGKKDAPTQEFKDRLIRQICYSFVGISNMHNGDYCQIMGNIYSNTNYYEMDRPKYVQYLSKVLKTSEFIMNPTKNGFMIWNNEVKTKLTPIKDKKNLPSCLPDLDYKDKLTIVSKLQNLDMKIWKLFMDQADQTSIYVVDTEWNFNDDSEHGIRLLQISNLHVCLVILVDFKCPIPDFLMDFFFSPTILKIGYSLGGDLKKINNWLAHHNSDKLIETNLLTDLNVNNSGWVEGDPHVLGLQKLLPFCAPKHYHKFENSLKYNDLVWTQREMKPSTPKGNIRIEYAALDVLAGFYYFNHLANPSSNLFRIKMQIPDFEKRILERSNRVKENLMEYFETCHHSYDDYCTNKHQLPIKFQNQ